MKKVVHLVVKGALCIVGLLVAYALIGTILSLIPVNRHAEAGEDVIVYLERNNVHADIVVPTRTDRIDWTTVVPPDDTSAKIAGGYLAFGWGSQDFYLNVPKWKDLFQGFAPIKAVLKAISGMGKTALHATYQYEPVVGADCFRLPLSSAQYDALVEYILSSGKRDASGAFIRIDHSGYDQSDDLWMFYI